MNLITGKPDELISRMQSEGRNSPADLLISTDVGRLHRAEVQGLLQPVDSKVLTDAIPAHLRDPKQQWFGLTKRARPIMYVPGKVKPEQLSTIEDLADPKWKGKICVRSSDNIYNQSMVAALITQIGEEKLKPGPMVLLKTSLNHLKAATAIRSKQPLLGFVISPLPIPTI